MKRNLGNIDRRLHATLGVTILIIGLFYGSWWGLIGLIPLATTVLRWCPVYALFGFSTYLGRPDEYVEHGGVAASHEEPTFTNPTKPHRLPYMSPD